jgi:MOSC domain-containing protein YiiM
MDLIGKEFQAGDAIFRGLKYCDPCTRPNKLAGISRSFREAFFDLGGLVAEIIRSGTIRVGDPIIPPKKDY